MSSDLSGLEVVVGQGGSLHEKAIVRCSGTGNRLLLGSNAHLGTLGSPKIEFIGSNNTFVIGDGCVVKRGHYRFTGDNNCIVLGRKTTINGAYMLCDGGSTIELGEDCLLSYEIEFRTTDAHSLIDLNSGAVINPPESIKVGSHVWIGKGVCILQGVALADNVVVGTRALVTKSFDSPYVAIAGVPARVVRESVSWDRKPPSRA